MRESAAELRFFNKTMWRLVEVLRFKLRWWRWFLNPPNKTVMDLSGFDHATREILRERWRNREPKPE
jgi:hypothetical protein